MQVTNEDKQAEIDPHSKNHGVEETEGAVHSVSTRQTAPGPPLDLSFKPRGLSFLFI